MKKTAALEQGLSTAAGKSEQVLVMMFGTRTVGAKQEHGAVAVERGEPEEQAFVMMFGTPCGSSKRGVLMPDVFVQQDAGCTMIVGREC